MVKKLFVSGLSSRTTTDSFRTYFEKFGNLYECQLPRPSRYLVYDHGPDEESINARSNIRYTLAKDDDILEDEYDVEKYDKDKHGSFEMYMSKIGEGESFTRKPRPESAGYGIVTFIDREGYNKCMEVEDHVIDDAHVSIEHANNERDSTIKKVKSKKLFVSFYPLKKLTAIELKKTFGSYGRIMDVEFVSDHSGPLHFCLITFSTAEAVDEAVKDEHFVQDTRLFVRRGVTKEALKLAEQKEREESKRKEESQHGYAGYRTPARIGFKSSFEFGEGRGPSEYFQKQLVPDPSMMAGYAPILKPTAASNPAPVDDTEAANLLSNYGYGPREW